MNQPIQMIKLAKNWKLLHKERNIEIASSVPNSVFEDLLKNNSIDDPFYGNVEHKVNWVYESDWDYEINFSLKDFMSEDESTKFLKFKNIQLVFYGLDCVAEIFLNKNSLGTVKNTYRSFTFDIKKHLNTENNTLTVKFKSPTKFAKSEIKKYGPKLNTGPFAIPGVPYLRKPQYSFGWDWGPKLPDIGIWKEVEIIGWNDIKIQSFQSNQVLNFLNKHDSEFKDENVIVSDVKKEVINAEIDFKVELDRKTSLNSKKKYQIEISLEDDTGKIYKENKEIHSHTENLTMNIKNPKLWWVHNLGEPNLYDLSISLLDVESGIVIDSKKSKFGIRSIKLIRNPDKWGESFYFRLNGVPLFAKGANWIPIDNFIPRGERLGLYEMNLNYAKDANMNFIRVWGGGFFETEHFYHLCDRLGILIWQDFPFACATYPANEEFFEEVKIEAIENIKRLRNHPSLALWCGNNEIEMGWLWYSRNLLTPEARSKHKKAYYRIFEDLFPKLIQELDPDHSYWPSSPSNGTMKDGGSIKSNNPTKGDSHYWMVWHGGKPFTAYRKFDSRFMSEYGFESFPSIKTIESFCPKEEYNFHSSIMENHQKNTAGNKKIMNYMKKRYSIPKKFEKQVILSQITHGEAMEYGVEHWRRNRNDYHCMGSLYWQLNDCWPVASWASIDYYARWKALHYFARRFYQNIFPSVLESKKSAEFWITNDELTTFNGVLNWEMYNSKDQILIENRVDISIEPGSSSMVDNVDLSKINKVKRMRRNNVIFYTLKDRNDSIFYQGFKLFEEPKHFSLKDPNISLKFLNSSDEDIIPEHENALIVEITCKHSAFYVYIESDTEDFLASDNFFPMKPNEVRRIEIWTDKFNKCSSKESLKKSIYVGSLYSILK